MDKLLTTQDVAETLGTSTWHIEKLRKTGALPSVKLGATKLVRFRPEDVQAFVAGLAKEQSNARGVRSIRPLASAK
jgi:excisionase family DNA binding protein